MNQRIQILRALTDGPGTSSELAAETGLPLRQCSAILSTLYRCGRITRSVIRLPNMQDSRRRTAFTYSRRTAA